MKNAHAIYEGRFVVRTLAGTGEAGYLDGTKRTARFSSPSSIAVDHEDNVYVLDDGNSCVRKISSRDGQVTTLCGMNDRGAFGWPPGIPELDPLGGMAVAPSGDVVYVPDDYCIRAVSLTMGTMHTVAGIREISGFHDGPGNKAIFGDLSDIVIDRDGKTLIVSDSDNNCIRGISIEPSYVWTVAGTGRSGSHNGVSRDAQFSDPGGVALCANGDIIVVDSGNNLVRRISGGEVSTVAGTGKPGWRDGDVRYAEFNNPSAVVIDDAGRLYVVDYCNDCIRRIDLTSGRVATIAGSGEEGWRDGIGYTAAFCGIMGIAIGQNGVLYVGDEHNNVIRSIAEITEVPVSVDTLEGILNQDAVAPAIKAELRSILDEQQTRDDISSHYRAAEEARTTCKICFTRPLESLFVPCGHFVCCARCANEVAECPICRVSVNGRQRVYEA
eukprot:GEMP01036604.1.p1 GENE.GEMP01036604.1~~GEMP01036604.1.p1  ORF type:complete len:441 (+),score=127.00 GEMP01036604.1:356-1678(+)